MNGIRDFVRLVAQMRDAERTYTSNMTRSNLEAMSELQLRVDRELLIIIDEEKKYDQLMLELNEVRKTDEPKGKYTASI